MIAIIDFGSQYTQLIARRIRECRVYSEIFSCHTNAETIGRLKPEGIVLSGGPASVYRVDHHRYSPLFGFGVPVLGICYGMQLAAQVFGGRVKRSSTREYGPAIIKTRSSPLFHGLPGTIRVWMSHGDTVMKAPGSSRIIALTETTSVAGFQRHNFYGIQFHPEVRHTEGGKKMIENFLTRVCHARKSWTMSKFIHDTVHQIRTQAGDGKMLCAISGGVDSTVAATLTAQAVGKNLVGVFVDNGLLRHNEKGEVKNIISRFVRVRIVDARLRFMKKLANVKNPERKRKIIGREFIRVFEREADKIPGIKYLVQGTLYPDVIESGMGIGPSDTIKTHHNVGGLPSRMKLKVVEPLRMLFKDEVRKLGKKLGIPKSFIERKPFPGPGLAVRIVGPVTPQRLEMLRQADHILLEEAANLKQYHAIWQMFAVLLPLGSVGVMGDQRTYDSVIAIRAVESEDGMTADWVRLPNKFLAAVSRRITNEVKGINRVVLDITSKPPATIEWE